MPVTGTPKEIIHEEMHRFKHGQLHSGPDKYGHLAKSRKQAIAIALNVARKHAADGGGMPWFVRQEARGMLHTGPIRGTVPGRTDHVPLNVPNGSYVLPAQHVSHLGQNNTESGFSRLTESGFGNAIKKAPFGVAMPSIHHGRGVPGAPGARAVTFPGKTSTKTGPGIFAQGGIIGPGGDDEGVPIMAASGEFVVHPDFIEQMGREAVAAQHGKEAGASISRGQAIEHGHEMLDMWVNAKKKDHIKTLQKLPGPETS